MATFDRSFYQENEELPKLLKDVNAVLRAPDSNLFEQYAGISELVRTRRSPEKVGVLTVGLFNLHAPVRELAASALKQNYGLGDTSDKVLELLDSDQMLLKDTLKGIDQSAFTFLISQMDKLSKQNRRTGTQKIDFGSQHILIILRELGRCMKALFSAAMIDTHPLKELLESKTHRKSLPMIQRCLDSEDIFCRRRAILLIGELNLTLTWEQQNFDLILEQIDRPENRQDYLVTRDGLQALTAIVQQDASLKPKIIQVIQLFFTSRTYQLNDAELAEEHRYHTQRDCVKALGSLGYYSEIRLLLRLPTQQRSANHRRITQTQLAVRSTNIRPFNLLERDEQRFVSGVKEGFVEALSHTYYEQGYQQDVTSVQSLTLQQRKVINQLTTWINSKNRYVQQAVHRFLTQLPTLHRLRVADYLQQRLMRTIEYVCRLSSQLQSAQLQSAELQSWLQKRLKVWRDIATALGILFAHLDTLSLRLAREIKNQSALQDEKTQLAHLGKTVLDHLYEHCLHAIRYELLYGLDPFKLAIQESLWTVYELSTNIPNLSTITSETIAPLSTLEQNKYCRPILLLLQARLTNVVDIAQSLGEQDDEFVRGCIEIEQQIQTRGQIGVLSKRTIDHLVEQTGKAQGIPDRLIRRLMPVLAEMQTPEATRLIQRLIALNDDGSRPFVVQLREWLCGYQCYELRDDLVKLWLRDLKRRYRNRDGLRLGYLNLLRAGEYRQQQAAQDSLNYPQPDPLIQRILTGLNEIQEEFTKQDLPILWSKNSTQEYEDYLSYQVAGFDNASQSINTLLYRIESSGAKRTRIKTYLRSISEKKAWIFLDRALTDVEIVTQMMQALQEQPNPDESVLRGSYRVLGRVERIADDYSGVYVDIGLRQFPLKYVSNQQLLGDRNTDDPRLLQELLGATLAFQISVCIDTQERQIQELELDGRESLQKPLRKQDITLRGRLVGFSDNSTSPGAVFQIEGKGASVTVPLYELSWRKDTDWLKTWRTHLNERRNEVFIISYNSETKHWSLRSNPPKDEHFLKYLYERNLNSYSNETEDLTYVNSSNDGYVFEIKAGILFYLPEERLLEFSPEGYDFFLSKRTLKQGTRLSIAFTTESLHGRIEPIFKVQEVRPVGEMPTKGMRIEGRFKPLDDPSQSEHAGGGGGGAGGR